MGCQSLYGRTLYGHICEPYSENVRGFARLLLAIARRVGHDADYLDRLERIPFEDWTKAQREKRKRYLASVDQDPRTYRAESPWVEEVAWIR